MSKYISWNYMKSELKLYKLIPLILVLLSSFNFFLMNIAKKRDFDFLFILSTVKIYMFISFFILGVLQFRYLNNKSQLDFIHSLPMKREKILFSKFLSGITLVCIPYVLVMTIINLYIKFSVQRQFNADFLVSTHFVSNTVIINGLTQFVFKQIVAGISIYSFSILVSLITGGVIFQLLGSFVIFWSPILICDFLQGLNKQFSFFGFTLQISEIFSYFSFIMPVDSVTNIDRNPQFVFANIVYKDIGNQNPIININTYTYMGLVFYLVISTIFLTLAIYSYKKRKTEYAATPIVFYKLRVFLQTIISFEGGLILTCFLSIELNKFSIFFVGIIGVICSYFFCEVLLNRGITKLFKRIIFVIPPIILLVVSYLIVTLL